MLRDFASPQSIGGSPASWVDHSLSAYVIYGPLW